MNQTASGLIAFAMLMAGFAFANAKMFGDTVTSSSGAAAGSSVLGLLALAYPAYAIMSADSASATLPDVLGAGLSALGNLLALAALFVGHFRILRLHSRAYTGLCGFAFGLIGFALGAGPLTALMK